MKRSEIVLICLVFLAAFFLRFYDISHPSFRYMDEGGHVMAASNYWNNGQTEPDNWEHPPLRHLLLYGFLQVFGDNPYGWRMRNVLFGAATALALGGIALFVFD
jgi:4-amino-4-deoxy-L-arabinose transferase-like glycosyltransferase